MVLISDGGGAVDMGGIVQMLQELLIDNVVIEEILSGLRAGEDRAEATRVHPIQGSRFGTLANGLSMGHHTELARQAVMRDALTILSDLQHFDDGVETFRKGVNVADEHAKADLDHITMEVGSVRTDSEGGFDK